MIVYGRPLAAPRVQWPPEMHDLDANAGPRSMRAGLLCAASRRLRRGCTWRAGDCLDVAPASSLATLPSGTPLLRMVAPAVLTAVTRAVTMATASSANLLVCCEASRAVRLCGASLPADFRRVGALSGRSGCRSSPGRSFPLGMTVGLDLFFEARRAGARAMPNMPNVHKTKARLGLAGSS